MNYNRRDQASWGAIIPAAGLGTRMKGCNPKQFLELGNRPVIVHTLARVAACPYLRQIVVAAPPGLVEETAEMIKRYGIGKVKAVIAGGETRQRSVALGLAALDKALDYILVHDGVRPLIDQRTIERVLVAARETGAATAAIPVQDTLAKVDKKNNVSDMPSRERLWLVQTPQAFWRPILEEAQEKAWADDHVGTDEAGLVLRISKPVCIVEGSPLNFKLTTSHDLRLAEAILRFGEV